MVVGWFGLVPSLLCLQYGLIRVPAAFLHHTHQHHLFQQLVILALQWYRWDRDPAGLLVQVHINSQQSWDVHSTCGWTPPVSHHNLHTMTLHNTWGWHRDLLYESCPRCENALSYQKGRSSITRFSKSSISKTDTMTCRSISGKSILVRLFFLCSFSRKNEWTFNWTFERRNRSVIY